ncbi:MAG: TetR/AcrR family transcriptional regulator [Allomuricauda sp.]|nr:MAG: TetR/AcrR family transcriptional regulator [Allomuricauda sp.]
MERLLQSIKITINDKIFVKDPDSSELGRRILEHSIVLIDEIGFEAFTFKKLGDRIGSNESSIYRYFENKHKLLVYLTSWYWGWLEYQLVFATNSLPDASDKLKKAIEVVTRTVKEDNSYSHINEVVLNRIVINESSKSFLTKEVDEENRNGYFVIYKRIVERLAEMITQVDAGYAFPSSLASTILEGALHQYFLKDHFPALTDCDSSTSPTKYFTELVFKTLNQNSNV